MACENCIHWSFRVETESAWGACASPIVQEMLHISTVKCDIDRKSKIEISRFAEVCTRSDFSCRFFEDASMRPKQDITGRCDKTMDLFGD